MLDYVQTKKIVHNEIFLRVWLAGGGRVAASKVVEIFFPTSSPSSCLLCASGGGVLFAGRSTVFLLRPRVISLIASHGYVCCALSNRFLLYSW